MNKIKLALAAFLAIGLIGSVEAGTRRTPESSNGASVSPVYGGVEFDMVAFSSAPQLAWGSSATVQSGAVMGVYFSSGPCDRADFILFKDTNTSTVSGTYQNNSSSTFRMYNIYGSTTAFGAAGSGLCSGFQTLPYGIRIKNGLVWNVSVSSYNEAGVLYYKEGN